ncbi:TRAFAC clade GTPase domain-containing protein [Alkalihalobacterium chitinilyticum]|uniref:Double-GTPase 2 domain-containing protein n=1 Tax=Alkalihalobacterium chitinilyticum TaxID=2980103 RepID=A0ABT5VFV7_9BACI|nr:hypothetical protein [Alkalihalobacterium chitinilyticum]MDE5414061.1 hypothetical protein [Alkalihalobacterium chitinilyticum]
MKEYVYRTYFVLSGLFLLIGIAYWSTDVYTLDFRKLVGISGSLLFLLLGMYRRNYLFSFIGYGAFIWGFAPLFHFHLFPGSYFNESYLLYFTLAVVLFIIKPPPTFLSGFMYSFLGVYLYRCLSDYFASSESFSIEMFNNIDLLAFAFSDYFWVYLFIGYVTSVLPYYINRQSTDDPRFHFVTLFPVFIMTFPFQALVGVSAGLYRALMNYKGVFQTNVIKEKEEEAKRNVQPAYQNYWLRKAFKDIFSTYRNTLQVNMTSLKNFNQTSNQLMSRYGICLGMIPFITWRIGAISVVSLGFVFLSLFSLFHIIVVGLISLAAYIYLAIFYVLDQFHLKSKKVNTVCPSCYHKSELPDYLCFNCGTVHSNLRPGLFGVRKRKCQCGQDIPATYLTERHELHSVCKECHKPLHTKEATPFCVSVIGGPLSGKTSFVTSTIQWLRHKVAPERGWDVEFLNEDDKLLHEQKVNGMQSGHFPAKTSETKPFAMNVKLTNKNWRNDKLLYFYDPAGEAYSNTKELARHSYYDYLDGLILVIDPFALPNLASELEEELRDHPSKVNQSAELLDDTFDKLMVHLAKNIGIKENKKLNIPLAIVINKVDAFGLEERISSYEVSSTIDNEAGQSLDNHPKSELERMNNDCKAFLSSVGYQFFVNQLESKFSRYQFFLSSSVPTSSSENNDCTKPLLWLLKQRGDIK